MIRMVFFIALAFLLSVSIILLPVQVYAQRNITVLNPSFEKPDSGKVTGFDGKSTKSGVKLLDIPNWNVDATNKSQYDSGVELDATMSGKYHAFLMGGDSAIYQNLTRRVFEDDMIKLTVDAKNIYLGSSLKMELYYLDNDTIAKAHRVPIVTETKTLTGSAAAYSISYKGTDFPLATGYRLGILLDNVSPDSASWLAVDNVRLTNEDSTIIEVTNYSFEQPDSNKIKGWNGPGSGYVLANSDAEIPGWTTDTVMVVDSGIDGRGLFDPQEGQYVGFLMGSDTSVWNTTDYVIQDGDVITLRVLARNVWAAEILRTEMYYVDANNNRVTLAFDDQAPLNTDQTWGEQSIGFAAASTPACVGKKLGVLLDNSSPTGASWIDFDLVRLNANHAVVQTSVSQMQLKPAVFSLAQNYPNPFNPSTNISYLLKNTGKVRLSVYDILGREVAVLANEIQTAGAHEVTFSANGLSSGIYFYKLQAANGVITKKMMLLK
jgi:hypothetical protein